MINLEDLQKGDIIYEDVYGQTLQIEVISEVIKENTSYIWKGKTKDNKIIDYKVDTDYLQYGPKLYNNKYGV